MDVAEVEQSHEAIVINERAISLECDTLNK
jgi:hypothetical protein